MALPSHPLPDIGPVLEATHRPRAEALARIVGMLGELLPGCAPVMWMGDQAAPDQGAAGSAPPFPQLASLWAEVLRSGQPLHIENLRDDLRFRRELGGAVGAPLAVLAAPACDTDAHVLAVVGVVRDLPGPWPPHAASAVQCAADALGALLQRDRLADQLQHSDARYHRLLCTSPVAIFALDRTGRVTELNPYAEAVLGRPAGELLGHRLQDLVAPEDQQLAADTFGTLLAGGEAPHDLELRVVRPGGAWRVVQVSCARLEERGQLIGVQGVGRDVTEQRTREMQFRRVERMAGVAPLLRGICHELNNPLTSIKSFAELLLLDERAEEDREALEIVLREADRAAGIVSDLRVVARQSQETSTARVTTELNGLVHEVLTARRAALSDEGILVREELAPGLPSAWAVRSQLDQVLRQLLANAQWAVRETTASRQITVRTYRGSLGVALEVTDTGCGIRPEDLNRIFDPFWTTREAGEGTGLGLSLVQSIVTDHGGRIRVDSKPGHGATFIVDLPATAEPPTRGPDDRSAGTARRRLRVLVVDDEAPIRASLAHYLERRGHAVDQAAEGSAALALLEESTNGRKFDIIIADLRMPGLDGEQLLARLRQRGDQMDQRLIFITGDAESPDAARVLSDAGAPVVWKPFELAEVAQIVEVQAGIAAT